MNKISINAQIAEIEWQITQHRSGKFSMRSINEAHRDRLRHVLNTLRWLKDNRELLLEVNKQLAAKGATLAPIADTGGADESVH